MTYIIRRSNIFLPKGKHMETIDFKKTQKQYYKPKTKPEIINIPQMNFIYVEGQGNPGDPNGTYTEAIGLIYQIAYTLKMGLKKGNQIKGYFDYVVCPLEGLWEIKGLKGYDKTRKDEFVWTSMMRVPDFITKDIFDQAIKEATQKKQTDFSKVKYQTFKEGLVVQMMHIGPYDDEIYSVDIMDQYIKDMGYVLDFNETRKHHEIYLSDPRRTQPEKLKTILRHPIKKQ